MAKKIGAKHYVECSSKTGEGVREVFQIATRKALRPHPKPRPKRFNKLIKGLLKSSSKNEEDVDSESAPQLGASEEQELKKLLVAAVAVAPPPLEKFRLLIIGKMGRGKTTILYKVSTSNQLLHLTKPLTFRSRCVAGIW
jgi:Ras family protein A